MLVDMHQHLLQIQYLRGGGPSSKATYVIFFTLHVTTLVALLSEGSFTTSVFNVSTPSFTQDFVLSSHKAHYNGYHMNLGQVCLT